MNFINRLKYAEQKSFCICIDVYKTYEGDDFNKISEALSRLKIKNLKIINIFIKKFEDMNKYPNFEQNNCSKTAEGI